MFVIWKHGKLFFFKQVIIAVDNGRSVWVLADFLVNFYPENIVQKIRGFIFTLYLLFILFISIYEVCLLNFRKSKLSGVVFIWEIMLLQNFGSYHLLQVLFQLFISIHVLNCKIRTRSKTFSSTPLSTLACRRYAASLQSWPETVEALNPSKNG